MYQAQCLPNGLALSDVLLLAPKLGCILGRIHCCHQIWLTSRLSSALTYLSNVMKLSGRLKNSFSFYSGEKRPASFYCCPTEVQCCFFGFVFGFLFSSLREKHLGNLVSLFSRINHHSDWRKKKKKKEMEDCLFVQTQEYFTEILYPVSDWLKAHP